MEPGRRDPFADQRFVNAFAHSLDDAERFGAADGTGQFGLVAIIAAHGPKVVVVNGREHHAQQRFASGGRGLVGFAGGQNLGGLAECVVDGSEHAVSFQVGNWPPVGESWAEVSARAMRRAASLRASLASTAAPSHLA